MPEGKRICIIGAGAAGLCAARLFKDVPGYQVTVYETQDDVGGTWCYSDKVKQDDDEPVHSSMYQNLRTNLPKEAMAFPDFPFPKGGPSFLHHTKVLSYLKQYASHFSLYDYIQFKSKVKEICHMDDNTWKVTVDNLVSRNTQQLNFNNILVCTGNYSVPLWPSLPGLDSYAGLCLHSHNYRNNSVFKGLNVVVLGAGPSGVDIGLEVAEVAEKVVLSHNLPLITSPLPHNMVQKPGIKSISGPKINFQNGDSFEASALIICTGYKKSFPFLHRSCEIEVQDDLRVYPLYKHIINVHHPSMAFIGIPGLIPPFPIFHQQVMFYLAILLGTLQLPSTKEMLEDINIDLKRRLDKGMKLRHAHLMKDTFLWEYDDCLSSLGCFPPISSRVREIYNVTKNLRKANLMKYKDHCFDG